MLTGFGGVWTPATIVGKGDILTEEPEDSAAADQPSELPRLSWSDDKNEQLKQERGLSFEQVARAFEAGRVLANLPHPNQTRYPNQRMLLIEIEGYGYAVPCVPTDTGYFLKTMYPSRQATRRYLHPRRDDRE